MSFVTELKRRNVFRVGVAYAIVAWLLIEITATTFPILKLPDWSVTLVTALVLIGFPLALIVAWAFELTPEGIKRETDVNPAETVRHSTGRKLDFAIIGLLALAVVFMFADNYVLDSEPKQADVPVEEIPAIEPVEREKSIAVLPFDNISPNPEDAYFADGIHDEVLAQLSKIRDLKVISRTSVMGYRGGNRPPLPEIAAALGVANILEGSVRLAGDRVRITTQLIEAESDAHLWTETYDRDLEDIFKIQSDVAQQIASALRVRLTAGEIARIEKKPTKNLRAYNLYLMGKSRKFSGPLTWDKVEEETSYFEQAIAEDPNFAAAYAELGFTYYVRLQLGALRELAIGEYRRLAEMAIALDRDDTSANAIMSYVHLWDGDLQAGEARQVRVLELAPNASDSYRGYANWPRSLNEQISYTRMGVKLDPLSSVAWRYLVELLIQARQFAEAIQEAEEAYTLDSDRAAISLADAYFHGGREQESREVYLHALKVYSSLERTPHSTATLAYINGMLGREEQAHVLLRKLEVMSQTEYVFPIAAANAYASIQDAGRTFDSLERGLDELGNWFDIDRVRGPLFDFLRTDPRYGDLLNKANPEVLERYGLKP